MLVPTSRRQSMSTCPCRRRARHCRRASWMLQTKLHCWRTGGRRVNGVSERLSCLLRHQLTACHARDEAALMATAPTLRVRRDALLVDALDGLLRVGLPLHYPLRVEFLNAFGANVRCLVFSGHSLCLSCLPGVWIWARSPQRVSHGACGAAGRTCTRVRARSVRSDHVSN